MATVKWIECAVCKEIATEPCGGCKEGLDENGNKSPTYYCSPICQRDHWEEHKTSCRNTNYRKQLFRAAEMCKRLMLTTNELAFDINIASVEKQGDELHVTPEQPVADKVLFDFPYEMFPTAEDKESMLVWQTCHMAAGRMYPLVDAALRNSYTRIREVVVKLPTEKNRIVINGSKESLTSHRVFKVDLEDGKSYSFDLAGAQWGNFQTVRPWPEYLEKMETSTIEVTQPFGHAAAIEQRLENEFRAAIHRTPRSEWQIDPVQTSITRFLHRSHWGWTLENLNVAAMICAQIDPFEKTQLDEFETAYTHGLNRFMDFLEKDNQAKARSGNPDVFEEFYVWFQTETPERRAAILTWTPEQQQVFTDMARAVSRRHTLANYTVVPRR